MKPMFMSSPHSGEQVPEIATWLSKLPEPILMCDVDRYVDTLYKPAADKFEIPFIVAKWHRYVADLNRLPEDVDPTCVDGAAAKGTFPEGMGIHWSSTTKGDVLMPAPMSVSMHEEIIEKYFWPFHRQIEDQYKKIFADNHDWVLHIDCHSMPSVGTPKHADPGQTRPEIVVSDVNGQSCRTDLKDLVIQAYDNAGFQVAYNFPYKGGRVTETYGQPLTGQNAIQVEMSRALYMDEDTKKIITEKAQVVRQKLLQAIGYIWDSL